MSVRSLARRAAHPAWVLSALLTVLATVWPPALGAVEAAVPAELAAPSRLLDVPVLLSVPDPRDNGHLHALTADHRLLRSTDGGESWQEIGTPDGLPEAGISDLEIDPRRPDTLYATPRAGEAPFYRSLDGGESWEPAGAGLPGIPVFDVVAEPAGGVELIGIRDAGSRVFRSVDRGATWSEVGEIGDFSGETGFRPRKPVAVSAAPDLVYVTGTFYVPGFCGPLCIQERLYRSLDGGESWTSLDLPFFEGPGHLRIDPSDPDVLYAAAEGAFYRSTDRGESWDLVRGLTESEVVDLRVDPRREGAVYRATFSDGVLVSKDGGETWRPVAPGFAPVGLRHLALLGPPFGPDNLFAAGAGGLWELEVPPPVPPGPSFAGPAIAGFRAWVRITGGDGQVLPVREESVCIPETLCVSGAVPGRSEVFLRIVGPKPNGRLWPTLVKFSTSRVEVWIEQIASGEVEYYVLPGAQPGVDELDGLFDREGFEP